jgi:hypothetical protein
MSEPRLVWCERCGTTFRFESQKLAPGRLERVAVLVPLLTTALSGRSLERALEAAHHDAQQKASERHARAVAEVLRVCPNCGRAACQKCWNTSEGACIDCAPVAPNASAASDHPSWRAEPSSIRRWAGGGIASLVRQAALDGSAIGGLLRSARRWIASTLEGRAASAAGRIARLKAGVTTTGARRPGVSRASLVGHLEAIRERVPLRSQGRRRWLEAAALAFAVALIGGTLLLRQELARTESAAADGSPQAGPQGALGPSPGTIATPSERVAAATPTASPPPPTVVPSRPPTSTSAPSQPPPAVTVAVSRAWQDSLGLVEAHIVVEVLNEGLTRIRIRASQSSYVVRGDDGRSLANGHFAYAFPSSIGPGERAYLIETAQLAFVSPEQVDRIEPDVQIAASTAREPELEVSDLSWTGTPNGDTLSLSGMVTNPSRTEVTNGVVGVIFLDAAGAIVGGLYDNVQVGKLAPGETRKFQTKYPGTGPLDPTAVASVRAFAYELQP